MKLNEMSIVELIAISQFYEWRREQGFGLSHPMTSEKLFQIQTEIAVRVSKIEFIKTDKSKEVVNG